MRRICAKIDIGKFFTKVRSHISIFFILSECNQTFYKDSNANLWLHWLTKSPWLPRLSYDIYWSHYWFLVTSITNDTEVPMSTVFTLLLCFFNEVMYVPIATTSVRVLLYLQRLTSLRYSFLGDFAKLQRVSISFVISLRTSACLINLSVRPHGTTRLPLDRLSRNLIFSFISKIYFIKIWKV
jgi:hypothetical protein